MKLYTAMGFLAAFFVGKAHDMSVPKSASKLGEVAGKVADAVE
jgi:hypothetical protein